MKKLITLLLISSFTLFNSCDQSNSQLFDLVLEIKSQNDQLLNEVKTLQLKSDLLIAELRLSAAKQEELLLKVTELQDQLSTILSQINSLNQQLNAQDADIQLIKNQLADLQTQYQGIFKQLEELQKLSQILAEVEKMKTQITQLDTRYTSILAGLVQNKQQLDALKTQITSTQTQLADNLTKISQLIGQLGDQGVVISNILKQIELIKNNNAELIKLLENLLLGKSQIPTDGLVGWWPFNGNANDESGYGNNGNIFGEVTPTLDRFNNPNKAYKFDGRSGYISCSRNIYSVFTTSLWFKTNQLKSYNPLIDVYNGVWEIFINNNLINYVSFGNNSYQYFPSQNPIKNDTWHHVALVYNNAKITIYVDGVLSLSKSVYSIPQQAGKFIFGASPTGGVDYFNGTIDDIRIYNKELTQEQITYLSKN